MLKEIVNVGELRKSVNEAANEFNAKIGANVETENKRNNEKSYKESSKRAKNFDGGLKDAPTRKEIDRSDDKNQGMLDYTPKTEPDKNYKERIKAQAKGYTSAIEEKNKTERNAEFDDNAINYKAMKKNATKRNKEKTEMEHSGIVSSNLPKVEKNTMYESVLPKAKRLIFKHTTFISESQMLSRIPEEYKVHGQKIYMKDKKDNEYIVECIKREHDGKIETNIINFNNERVLNEKLNRMQELFNYDTTKAQGPNKTQIRVNEGKNFKDLLNHARNLSKENKK